MSGIVGFGSTGDAKRVVRAARQVEEWQRSSARPERTRASASDPVQLVEVLGGPLDGIYPARIVSWDDSEGDYNDLGDVKFKEANANSVMPGTYLMARYNGLVASGDASLYVSAFTCCGGDPGTPPDSSDPWFCTYHGAGTEYGCRQFEDSTAAEAAGWTVGSGPHTAYTDCTESRCVAARLVCGPDVFAEVDPGDTLCLAMTYNSLDGPTVVINKGMHAFENVLHSDGRRVKKWICTISESCERSSDGATLVSAVNIILIFTDGCWAVDIAGSGTTFYIRSNSDIILPPVISNVSLDTDTFELLFSVNNNFNADRLGPCIGFANVAITVDAECDGGDPVPGSGGWYCSHQGTADSFDCRQFASQAEAEATGYTVVSGPYDSEITCGAAGCAATPPPSYLLTPSGARYPGDCSHTFQATHGDTGLPPLTFDIDWGDGDTETLVAYTAGPTGDGFEPYFSHVYTPDSGPHTITLTVTDSLGQTDTATADIDCGGPPGSECSESISITQDVIDVRPIAAYETIWYSCHLPNATGSGIDGQVSINPPSGFAFPHVTVYESCGGSSVASSTTGYVTWTVPPGGLTFYFKIDEADGYSGDMGVTVGLV